MLKYTDLDETVLRYQKIFFFQKNFGSLPPETEIIYLEFLLTHNNFTLTLNALNICSNFWPTLYVTSDIDNFKKEVFCTIYSS